MESWPDCPEEEFRKETYYCHILGAQRVGWEEEICGICRRFLPACQKEKRLEEAFSFAREAHHGQMRKGTKIPYLIHLIRTWHYTAIMEGDLEEQQAALLHDVLEDTPVKAQALYERFGRKVLRLVVGESEYKREDKSAQETWKLRKMETIERMRCRLGKEQEHAAMRIAFADKLANLYSMWFEYRLTGERMWDKFNQKKKSMHGWYYGEMGKIFTQYFDGCAEMPLLEEYRKYYQEVFHHEI